jgi:hypothetical protein
VHGRQLIFWSGRGVSKCGYRSQMSRKNREASAGRQSWPRGEDGERKVGGCAAGSFPSSRAVRAGAFASRQIPSQALAELAPATGSLRHGRPVRKGTTVSRVRDGCVSLIRPCRTASRSSTPDGALVLQRRITENAATLPLARKRRERNSHALRGCGPRYARPVKGGALPPPSCTPPRCARLRSAKADLTSTGPGNLEKQPSRPVPDRAG